MLKLLFFYQLEYSLIFSSYAVIVQKALIAAQLDCKQNLNSSMDFILKLFCKTHIRFACCKSFISRRIQIS